jgi:hypothetical protein
VCVFVSHGKRSLKRDPFTYLWICKLVKRTTGERVERHSHKTLILCLSLCVRACGKVQKSSSALLSLSLYGNYVVFFMAAMLLHKVAESKQTGQDDVFVLCYLLLHSAEFMKVSRSSVLCSVLNVTKCHAFYLTLLITSRSAAFFLLHPTTTAQRSL